MSLQNDSNKPRRKIDATRVIASAVGILCGISGLEHGFFETLQGNVAPDGILSSAIGPAHRFWSGGTLHALTIIPNYLLTGILATLFSLMVIIWSVGFIHRKRGASVFLVLSILQFLVGGGFGQIFLVLVTAIAATRINAPMHWWRTHLPPGVRRFLAKIWLWLLIGFVLSFSAAMFAGIFGYLPAVSSLFDLTSEKLPGFLYILGYTALGLLLLAFLAGFSHNIEKWTEPERGKDEYVTTPS